MHLFELYEAEVAEEGSAEGAELHIQVQRDWNIFSISDPEQIHSFLLSAVGSHDLLVRGVLVRLKVVDGDDGSEALSSWGRFSDEIRTRNRYFPQTVPDRELLERVMDEHRRHVSPETELFRARAVDALIAPPAEEMGAPPPNKARAGRANPVGIPYLYLAFSEQTCIHEARATMHARLAVGTFKPVRELQLLDLADITAPDFFSAEDLEDAAEQIRRVSFHRYLTALGHELHKPIRSTDQLTDYIPTQYLCELAKAINFDGVLYASSQDPGGRNMVLFDASVAVCTESVRVVEVTALKAEWSEVDQAGPGTA